MEADVAALDELQHRDPRRDLRKALRERPAPPRPGKMDYDPDDPVN